MSSGPVIRGRWRASLLVGAPHSMSVGPTMSVPTVNMPSDDVVVGLLAANTRRAAATGPDRRAQPATTNAAQPLSAFGALPGPRLGDERLNPRPRCGIRVGPHAGNVFGIGRAAMLVEPGRTLGPRDAPSGCRRSLSPPVWSRTDRVHLPDAGAAMGSQWRRGRAASARRPPREAGTPDATQHQEELGIDRRGRRAGRSEPVPLSQRGDRPPGLQLVDAEQERTDQREVLSSSTDVEGRHVVLVADRRWNASAPRSPGRCGLRMTTVPAMSPERCEVVENMAVTVARKPRPGRSPPVRTKPPTIDCRVVAA